MMSARRQDLETAAQHLRDALKLARTAPRTAARIRLAISSIKSTIRHADGDALRAERGA